jgi:hypothetical protein
VYTLETSYSGYFEEASRFTHFSITDFKAIGRSICLALFKQTYRRQDPRKFKQLAIHDAVSESDSDASADQLEECKTELVHYVTP